MYRMVTCKVKCIYFILLRGKFLPITNYGINTCLVIKYKSTYFLNFKSVY